MRTIDHSDTCSFSYVPNMEGTVPSTRNECILIQKFDSKNPVGVAFIVPFCSSEGHLNTLCSLIVYPNVKVFAGSGELRSMRTIVHAQNRIIRFVEAEQFLPGWRMPKGNLSLPTSFNVLYESTLTRTLVCVVDCGRHLSDVVGALFILSMMDTIFS